MTFLILSSIPIQSGTGIRVSNVAGALAGKGHEVIMTGIGPRPEGLEGVRYVRVPSAGNRAVMFLVSLAVNLVVSWATRCDIVISSKSLPNSALPVLLTPFRRRIKVLDLDDLEFGYWAGTWLESVLRATDKIFVRAFDKIAVHTEELRDYAVGRLGKELGNVVFLRQGVSFSFFQDVKGTVRVRFGLEGKKVILYAAHLGVAARGGLEFIFRGCERVFEEIDDAMLMVVGSGDLLARYKRLTSDMGIGGRVVFTGGVPYAEMADFFASADVSVNYLEDTEANRCRSSIKVRESLAAGTPVVCNLVGSDLLQFRDFVYLFDSDSMEGFSKTLSRLLSGTDTDRVESGKKFIRDEWDWTVVVDDFLRVINDVEQ